MMGSLLIGLLAAGGSADALVKHQVKALSLQVPAAWTRSVEEGTEKFLAPSGDAYFLVDVGTVQTEGMRPRVCLEKIITGIGGEGWERLSVNAQPVARRVDVDAAPDSQDKVETITYVGCDGKTTWSIVFHLVQSKKERFSAVAKKVAESVSYVKAGGK